MDLTAQTGTILDDDEECLGETEVTEVSDTKDKRDLVTRKGSWHSHISERSRDEELSIGGT